MVVLSDLNQIAENYGLDLIYLFGSKAMDLDTERSDTDIAVLLERQYELDLKELMLDLIYEFSRVFNTDKIDLLILNKAGLALQYKVVAEGKNLYYKSAKIRSDYEERAIKLYLDFKKFEDEYYEAMYNHILED